jgi:hypothetical protein
LNDKQVIRYVGFNSTDDGGRALDFSVGPTGDTEMQIVVSIPGTHFSGVDRILFQEAAGIGFLKIKELCEVGTVGDTPLVSLNATDIGRFRQVQSSSGRRKGSFPRSAA